MQSRTRCLSVAMRNHKYRYLRPRSRTLRPAARTPEDAAVNGRTCRTVNRVGGCCLTILHYRQSLLLIRSLFMSAVFPLDLPYQL